MEQSKESSKESWSELGWMSAMGVLQEEVAEWNAEHFDPKHTTASSQLLRLIEKLGDFASAYESLCRYKRDDSRVKGAVEAICDAIIFLAGYCEEMGWELRYMFDARIIGSEILDAEKDPASAKRWLPPVQLLQDIGQLCWKHAETTQGQRETLDHEEQVRHAFHDLIRIFIEFAHKCKLDLLSAVENRWRSEVKPLNFGVEPWCRLIKNPTPQQTLAANLLALSLWRQVDICFSLEALIPKERRSPCEMSVDVLFEQAKEEGLFENLWDLVEQNYPAPSLHNPFRSKAHVVKEAQLKQQTPKKSWCELGWKEAMNLLQDECKKDDMSCSKSTWVVLTRLAGYLRDFVHAMEVREQSGKDQFTKDTTNAICGVLYFSAYFCDKMGQSFGDFTEEFEVSKPYGYPGNLNDLFKSLVHMFEQLRMQEGSEEIWEKRGAWLQWRGDLVNILDGLIGCAAIDGVCLLTELEGRIERSCSWGGV